MFISNSLNYKVVYRSSEYGVVECLFVEIISGKDKILMGVVYLPHGDFDALEREITDVLVRYSNIIIMGDFNSNLFDILRSQHVREICSRLNIYVRHNCCPTHFDVVHQSSSLIDYFLLSCPHSVKSSNQFICPSISKHAFIYMSLDIKVVREEKYFRVF